LNAICLFLAGALRATVPSSDLTLAWTHSIEKTRWEEHYRVDAGSLRLVLARVRGSGAGMEPGPGARFEDGWWTWNPDIRLTSLRLTLSPYAGDYDLCWNARCQTLRSFLGLALPATAQRNPAADEAQIVDLRACDGK
jgi:hypothetical protein